MIEIAPSSHSKEHIAILVDGEVWRSVDRKMFKFHFKTIEKSSSTENLAEVFGEIERKVAKNYSLYLLGLKGYLSQELKKKMREKGICSEIAEETLLYLTDLGYLDDRAWIESFIQSQQRKGSGKRVIEQKLKQKGAEESLYGEILYSFCSDERAREQITQILDKRYRNKDLSDPKEKNRAVNYLLRRGFDYSDVAVCMSSLAPGS